MKEKLGLNPWLSIWVKPRKTVRALVEYDVNFRFIVMCAIYGFLYMLQTSQFLALGQSSSLLVIIILSAVLAIPAGYIVFNISSFFAFLLGKLIKGKGSFKQIRAATYWSTVPMVVTLLFWIFCIVINGNSLFVPGYEKSLVGSASIINLVIGIAQFVLAIWGLIIYLHALGEVQGFSAWMALLNAFLAGLSIFILLFLVSWGVSALTHVT